MTKLLQLTRASDGMVVHRIVDDDFVGEMAAKAIEGGFMIEGIEFDIDLLMAHDDFPKFAWDVLSTYEGVEYSDEPDDEPANVVDVSDEPADDTVGDEGEA